LGRFREIRRGQYQLRYWRFWCDWVPAADRLALPDLSWRIRSGVQQGFDYRAVEWLDASGRAVLRLKPASHGLELWHRNAQGHGFHRHGVVAWQRAPVEFWLAYLLDSNPAKNCQA